MNLRKYIALVLICVSLTVFGQSEKYLNYIQQYREMAIKQMREHSIPASITMAQALLESGAGTSTLATKGKNHFGIKAHNDWTGPVMLKDDDAPNEKFRVYAFVEDSYQDHSLFLKTGRRYASLFNLSVTDYKGWAYGLKAAGYATSPTYAQKLIQIIEDYNLAELDQDALHKHHPKQVVVSAPTITQNTSLSPTQMPAGRRSIAFCNKNYYIIAQKGDTYTSIAKEYEVSERKLRKNNEVDKKYQLKAGDIVFFEKKQTKAHKSFKNKLHTMQAGESLYDVSQKYGMRLKTLYKLNGFTPDHMPVVGEQIKLR